MTWSQGREPGTPRKPRGPCPRASATLRALTLAYGAIVAASACGDEGATNAVPEEDERRVVEVRIQPATLGLAAPGDTSTLRAAVLDQHGFRMSSRTVTWTSSDPSVVVVDATGRVSARGLGFTHVSATASDVTDSTGIRVDPQFSVARNCAPCHTSLSGGHAALLFSVGTCWACHTMSGEEHEPPALSHVAASDGYELLGVHVQVACSGCHTDRGMARSAGDPQDCAACHGEAFSTRHGAAGFPTACVVCHAPTTWSEQSFDHEEWSGFALKWMHTTLACDACHVIETFTPRFNPTDEEDCYACHQEDYSSGHGDAAYPTTCLACHDTATWQNPDFYHLTSGAFALLGVHGTLACTHCHDPATFEPIFSPSAASDCVACHQSDYDREHGGSGFPTACTGCHTPTAWGDVTFDHAVGSGGFVLLGVHGTLACTSCHAQATFDLLFSPTSESDCIACHQSDYDGQHAGSRFPPTCLSCHQPDTWAGAVFDHDEQYFPIYSGDHRQRWVSGGCAVCHTEPTDYREFTCFACHRHSPTRAAQDHDGVDGYEYVSTACLACHRDDVD